MRRAPRRIPHSASKPAHAMCFAFTQAPDPFAALYGVGSLAWDGLGADQGGLWGQ